MNSAIVSSELDVEHPRNGADEPSQDDRPAIAAHSNTPKGHVKSLRFWAVITALSLTGMLAALESTIITSALPTIINTLGGGNDYVWVPNSYLLASIAILPLVAQLSDSFGRRWPMLDSVALFIFGSGLCGGASSMAMLIAGRTMYVLWRFTLSINNLRVMSLANILLLQSRIRWRRHHIVNRNCRDRPGSVA
jgi:hypothetical protein